MTAKVRYVRRRVIEDGCHFCRDLLAYTALAADGTELGEVRMVRLVEGHPGDWHYGVNWEGVLPDGTRVRGEYGLYESGVQAVFINRRIAGEALAKAANDRARRLAHPRAPKPLPYGSIDGDQIMRDFITDLHDVSGIGDPTLRRRIAEGLWAMGYKREPYKAVVENDAPAPAPVGAPVEESAR